MAEQVITNSLAQLKQLTTVVADTGDFDAMKIFQPHDATTNPTLIFRASIMPDYQELVDRAVEYARRRSGPDPEDQLAVAMDKLAVFFGCEILHLIPGQVSTEIDARLSFDIDGTVERAKRIIDMYEEEGVKKDRVLLKIAATWEGIQAARILEKHFGIRCNSTLIFSFCQAVACADSGVTLVSPYVGRVSDWYMTSMGKSSLPVDEDPGVQRVKEIYNYLKKFHYKTLIMAASFRSADQVKALAGIDLVTVSPELLNELRESAEPVPEQLSKEKAVATDLEKVHFDEKRFRWAMNEDEMATVKLAEGIRRFAVDSANLERILKERLTGRSSGGTNSL